jgi:hypothetical protein
LADALPGDTEQYCGLGGTHKVSRLRSLLFSHPIVKREHTQARGFRRQCAGRPECFVGRLPKRRCSDSVVGSEQVARTVVGDGGPQLLGYYGLGIDVEVGGNRCGNPHRPLV